MIVKDVTNYLESIAPLQLQESYDNAGLILGDHLQQVKGVLVCLDVNDKVIEEANENDCNLIIAHHPLIFSGLKKINPSNFIGKLIYEAIANNICIYAIHTNLDNVLNGVNGKMADLIDLVDRSILQPKNNLLKLTVFAPKYHAENIKNIIFKSGAGELGNYSNCSFSSSGIGTFKPNEYAKPFVGNSNEIENQKEVKIEVILPSFLKSKVIGSMINAHPYEEVAYDLIPLANNSNFGAGIVGDLKKEVNEEEFLKEIKKIFKVESLRHTRLLGRPIKRVAICGGSGSFLLDNAINSAADIFITSDFKYHQFFDAENKIIVADLGHYETEQYTIELIADLLMKNFTNFAIRLTSVNTNPINYL
jgi:dinuclear metal center YbgI/SA1388 family protein